MGDMMPFYDYQIPKPTTEAPDSRPRFGDCQYCAMNGTHDSYCALCSNGDNFKPGSGEGLKIKEARNKMSFDEHVTIGSMAQKAIAAESGLADVSQYQFKDCHICTIYDPSKKRELCCDSCDGVNLFHPADIRNLKRPEMTTGHYGEPRVCTKIIEDEPMKTKSTVQSFDTLIMKCQDTLSIESEIDKRYRDWMKGDGPKISDLKKPAIYLSNFISCLCISYHLFFNRADLFFFEIVILTGVSACWVVAGFSAKKFIEEIKKVNIKHWFLPETNKDPSEALKFQFAKEGYKATKENLNETLKQAQSIVRDRIKAHESRKADILEYEVLLGDVELANEKIDGAIKGLREDHKKLQDVQSEINDVIDEYIGDQGVLVKQEKEIQRVKMAQEVSKGMNEDFKITMEVRKGVEIISDTILPGLKRLMDFQIPQLVEDITSENDKQKAYLQISQ